MKSAEILDRAKNDLHYYLEHLVFTLDEHDKIHPIKQLPYRDKPHLAELADYFLTEPLLLVEKSRQMMVTWLMVACHLWDAQFHRGRRIFVQSKKEFDANELVNRAKFIYEHYPAPVNALIYRHYPGTQSYLRLEFGKQTSIIQGTPQGAKMLRQYTASRILSDEMAFQEEAEESFIAAKPTLVDGGAFIGVSSPNFREFFYRAVSDQT